MDSLAPEVLMFPITSFPYILNTRPELQECFLLDFEVRPGWIVYIPNVVTVLSCNQMFQPVYELNSIWKQDKQVFKIKCKDHLEDLKDMLAKPIVFCATRRQQGEALIDGFDTDFVLLLDPNDPKIAKQINKIVDRVEERLNSGQTFCLKINFSDFLDRLTLGVFKKQVYWLNTEFYITNHCRPNPFLQINRWLVWCAMFPVFLMASLPYRIQRKACVHDEEINLHVRFKLKFCPNTVLVLHFFSVDQPLPGRYLTHEKLYIERDCCSTELGSLVCFKHQDSIDEIKKRRTLSLNNIKSKLRILLEGTRQHKNKVFKLFGLSFV